MFGLVRFPNRQSTLGALPIAELLLTLAVTTWALATCLRRAPGEFEEDAALGGAGARAGAGSRQRGTPAGTVRPRRAATPGP